MKKALIIILAFILSLGLAACGKEEKIESTIHWPNSTISNQLPKPESTNGQIALESADYIFADIYDLSIEEYSDYVDYCMDEGFTVNYSRSTTFFTADNEAGYQLLVSYYEKEKQMSITFNAPEPEEDSTSENSSENTENDSAAEESTEIIIPESSSQLPQSYEEDSTAPKQTSEKSQEANKSIDPAFKDAMDSYEAFMDEYVDFMEKYNESEDSLSMFAEYADYMAKYAEAMEKISQVNEDELNTAEALYYAEVTSRVSAKLINVSM